MAPIVTQYSGNTFKANISQMKHHNGQEQLSNKARVRHVPAQTLICMFINMSRRS